MLLVHAPDVYSKLYDDYGEPIPEEFEVEDFVPQNEGDVQNMLADLRAMGIN